MTQDLIPAAKPIVGDAEIAAVTRVLRSGALAQGPEVAALEAEFAKHFALGCHAVAVSSGTTGLHLGLLACGVGRGDEVIVPSFTFAASANAVALTGATPVFADIEPDHFCLDPSSVSAAITRHTVGVMPVHLYGHPADMEAFQDLAQRHEIGIFEDAAQAHGAADAQGRPVGSVGRFGLFSLYPTKNMTSAEGGMITSKEPDLVQLLQLLRNQGMRRRYENEIVGYNARMSDIHAAIGRAQLCRVAEWTAARQANAAFLSENLRGVVCPKVAPGATHVYHQYTVRVAGDRDRFARALLDEHAIGSGVYYPTPVHRLASFDRHLDLPETSRAAREVLSLPVHPSLSSSDLERIVEAVNTVAAAGS